MSATNEPHRMILAEVLQAIPSRPHRATLDRWVRLGMFPPPDRFGRKLSRRKAVVEAWLASRSTESNR
jgi:hypothetical protein